LLLDCTEVVLCPAAKNACAFRRLRSGAAHVVVNHGAPTIARSRAIRAPGRPELLRGPCRGLLSQGAPLCVGVAVDTGLVYPPVLCRAARYAYNARHEATTIPIPASRRTGTTHPGEAFQCRRVALSSDRGSAARGAFAPRRSNEQRAADGIRCHRLAGFRPVNLGWAPRGSSSSSSASRSLALRQRRPRQSTPRTRGGAGPDVPRESSKLRGCGPSRCQLRAQQV